MIKTIIAEDEAISTRKITSFLLNKPDVEIVAECDNGSDALECIRDLRPDLLFLDVEMPGPSGFQILEQVVDPSYTCVIFTTAFDRYAIKAFDEAAVDFLLKPFDQSRFDKAFERALRFIAQRPSLVRNPDAPAGGDVAFLDSRNRFVVRASGRILFFRPSEINWIEAAANYVRIHLRTGATYLIRNTMQDMDKKLDPALFVRIHRSFIVNIERVRELEPCGGGEYLVKLQDGKSLPLGKAYRSRLKDLAQPSF